MEVSTMAIAVPTESDAPCEAHRSATYKDVHDNGDGYRRVQVHTVTWFEGLGSLGKVDILQLRSGKRLPVGKGWRPYGEASFQTGRGTRTKRTHSDACGKSL